MRWPAAVLLSGALWLPAVGCRNCDLVEAELRTKDRELREARDELDRSESFNHALQNEVQAIRCGAGFRLTPELAAQIYTLKEITLGRQTGGYDDDGRPGDEALQVVVEPRDPDGQAIKAPGSLHIEALQISPEGLKTPLSVWDIEPAKLRRTWQTGLLASGYHVILPWKVWPSNNRLRVVVRFTLSDGRPFEADKDLTIRLPPKPHANAPVLPDGEPLLPLPGPVEWDSNPASLPTPRQLPPRTPGDKVGPPAVDPAPPLLETTSWRRDPDMLPLSRSVHLRAPMPGR